MLGNKAALPWTTISLSARYEYSAALKVGSFSKASLYISKRFSAVKWPDNKIIKNNLLLYFENIFVF